MYLKEQLMLLHGVYTWKTALTEIPGVDIHTIHPLKQKIVRAIYDILNQHRDVIRAAYIFGSAIAPCCSQWSDTDICLDTDTTHLFFNEIQDCDPNGVDIVLLNRIDKNDNVYKFIMAGRRII